ncbi:MAG: hypothetical protein ABEJ40_03705 [Haloarculaceae archaeon]
MEEEDNEVDSVTATVELSGEYEEIANILAIEQSDYPELSAVGDDMGAVLEIVARTGGATKSRIADELPSGVTADLDGDNVIHVLRVLELYELVRLDGNTWQPGPALSPE